MPKTWPPVEEEKLPSYREENYLPVTIGQIVNSRYEIQAKLGYGGASTVWLVKDIQRWKWQKTRYFTIKILTRAHSACSSPPELAISQLLSRADPKHEGFRYVRTVLDSFQISGPSGNHLCLLYTPMRETLSTFQRRLPNQRVPVYLLKPLISLLLSGLEYMHDKCHLIHTDLKSDNILLGIEDDQIIRDMVAEEKNDPSPTVMRSDRQIHFSRNFSDLRKPPAPPKLSDFGLAVEAGSLYHHPIQPDLFQAPEVILRAGWSYSADIWNLGVMIWDFMEGRSLFYAVEATHDTYTEHNHLQEMMTLLGPPPTQLLFRGETTKQYFTKDGELILSVPISQDRRLEDTVTAMEGEEKTLFMAFISRMLKWLPEDRATASELRNDPWLSSR